jgi:cell division protein FtsL
MTTVASPSARLPARGTPRARTRAPGPTRAKRAAPATPKARVAAPPVRVGRLGTFLVLFTVFALVSAVVFHVLLAQHQLQLDHLDAQIAKEQRTYEQRRLTASLLASPQHVIQEAERLGLVLPPDPAQYLYVEGAPLPKVADGSSTTIAEWSKTKPSLDPQQP